MRHVIVMTAATSVGLMAIFIVDLLSLLWVSRLGDPKLTAAVGFAGSQGNFELNVFKPVIIYNFLHSVTLLSDACHGYVEFMIKGIEVDRAKVDWYVRNSLMLVTALAPKVGYDKAAQIAHTAHVEHSSLREAALKLRYLTGGSLIS